jgi:uncharacterized protein (DUF924 family)
MFTITNPQIILDFWFGTPDSPEYGKPRPEWFRKDPDFDSAIAAQFLPIYAQAAQGKLQPWQAKPHSCLALLIVLDQFPRNLFRGLPEAFATDEQACEITKNAIAQQFDQAVLPIQRWFFYLPLEHSENLANQARSLELFQSLATDPDSQSAIDYAQKHYDVIAQFGRFPHRNAILGRESTPAELAFLAQPGSTF